MPVVAIYTHTGLIPASYIEACVGSIQVALAQSFAPLWGGATLVYVPPGGMIQPDWWQAVLFDHSDQAGALGYHDVTPTGQPLAKIFAADCIADAENWNVTLSHEIWEMLVDPKIDQTVTYNGWVFAKEVADAPEDDRYAQRVRGHLISNAVTPAWFDPNGKPPYTMYPCAPIDAPLTLAPGGYIGRRQLPNGQWEQELAAERGPRQLKGSDSRTIRRFSSGR
jgi:hypothetical protein